MVLPSWSGSFTGISTLKFSAEFKKKKKKKKEKKKKAGGFSQNVSFYISLFLYFFPPQRFVKTTAYENQSR